MLDLEPADFRVFDDERSVPIDGTDTAKSASARSVMQRAAETNVSIYAVGVGSRYAQGGKTVTRGPDPIIREIAKDSGGV